MSALFSTPYFWFVFFAYLAGLIIIAGLLTQSIYMLNKSKKNLKD